jgi:hypothetical protein
MQELRPANSGLPEGGTTVAQDVRRERFSLASVLGNRERMRKSRRDGRAFWTTTDRFFR